MSHHGDGPSEQCPRCGGWFRDDHECLGRPPETIEKFVRMYGLEQIFAWARVAANKVASERAAYTKVEQKRRREALEEKVREGRRAAKELEKMK
jgi:hypothetical protein